MRSDERYRRYLIVYWLLKGKKKLLLFYSKMKNFILGIYKFDLILSCAHL